MSPAEYDQQAKKFSEVIAAAEHRITALESMFKAAAILNDEKEMEHVREQLKNLVDIKLDSVVSIYRLAKQVRF